MRCCHRTNWCTYGGADTVMETGKQSLHRLVQVAWSIYSIYCLRIFAPGIYLFAHIVFNVPQSSPIEYMKNGNLGTNEGLS